MSLFIVMYIHFSCNVNKWLSSNTISLNIFDRVPVSSHNMQSVRTITAETDQNIWIALIVVSQVSSLCTKDYLFYFYGTLGNN